MHVSANSFRELRPTAPSVGRAVLGMVAGVLMLAAPLPAQQRPPYTFEQLSRLVESDLFTEERILSLVRESCLGFEVDEPAEDRLQAAGASAAFLEALAGMCTRLPQRVVDLRLTPGDLELQPSEEAELTARALTPADTPAATVTLEWASADTSVAAVSGSGRVTGVAPGLTRITARTAEGVWAEARVRVRQPPVARTEPEEATGAGDGIDADDGTDAGPIAQVFPGGAQFQKGETVKGAIVLAGTIGALTAGYFLSSTERTRTEESVAEDCTGNSCTFEPRAVVEVRRKRRMVEGAVVAGVIWLGGIAEGLLADRGPAADRAAGAAGPASTARRSNGAEPGVAVELLPSGVLSAGPNGELLATLARVRW